jgi:hypothetical protein
MADMSAAFHIFGMPAAEAIALINSGKVIIGEDIAGPTGNGNQAALEAFAKAEAAYTRTRVKEA